MILRPAAFLVFLVLSNLAPGLPTTHVWSPIPASGPLPVARANAVFQSGIADGEFVLFGGYDSEANAALNDTWFYQGGAWQQIAATGDIPSARFGMTGIYDEPGKRLIVFGGRSLAGVYFNEVHALDLSSWVWTKLQPAGTIPPTNYLLASVFDAKRRRMIIHGGTNDSGGAHIYNKAYGLDLADLQWAEIVPTEGSLPTLYSHLAIRLEDRDEVFLFGGRASLSLYRNYSYLYSCKTGALTNIPRAGDYPDPCMGMGGFYDSAAQRPIIFGGVKSNGQLLSSLFTQNLASGEWEIIPIDSSVPGGRIWGEMRRQHNSDRAILFGGYAGSALGYRNDLWMLSAPSACQGTWADYR